HRQAAPVERNAFAARNGLAKRGDAAVDAQPVLANPALDLATRTMPGSGEDFLDTFGHAAFLVELSSGDQRVPVLEIVTGVIFCDVLGTVGRYDPQDLDRTGPLGCRNSFEPRGLCRVRGFFRRRIILT